MDLRLAVSHGQVQEMEEGLGMARAFLRIGHNLLDRLLDRRGGPMAHSRVEMVPR